MSNKWYGSLQNRLAEGHQFCDTIKVGTGVTEYHYSDRSPYEVVEVTDQKHISIRRLDHRAVGEPMSNNWELISNPKKRSHSSCQAWGELVCEEDSDARSLEQQRHLCAALGHQQRV